MSKNFTEDEWRGLLQGRALPCDMLVGQTLPTYIHQKIAALEQTLEQQREALTLCVEAIDNLLPGAKYIVADVGLINDALIKARPLLRPEE